MKPCRLKFMDGLGRIQLECMNISDYRSFRIIRLAAIENYPSYSAIKAVLTLPIS